MRILRKIACGIDIHKKIIVACIATTKNGKTMYEIRNFTTYNKDLHKLAAWLKEKNCLEACMESTGKYWIPVYNILEEEGIIVTLAHPKYVKALKGKKTDKKDAKRIADLFSIDEVPGSFIPPLGIRELRDLNRYKNTIVQERTGEKNRLQDDLVVSNFPLGNTLSDIHGVTGNNIINYVLTATEYKDDEIEALFRGPIKPENKKNIKLAVQDCKITPNMKMKIKLNMDRIAETNKQIEQIEKTIDIASQPYIKQIEFIANQMVGIGIVSATKIVAEIGVDMGQFRTSRQLCSWSGLTPANNESANKKKTTRIAKGNSYLKTTLVECALAAIKAEGYWRIKYLKIKARRGHKKAIIAVARKMLTCIYYMLKTGEVFNPTDYDKVVNPQKKEVKAPQRLTSDKEVYEFLKAKGVSDTILKNLPLDYTTI